MPGFVELTFTRNTLYLAAGPVFLSGFGWSVAVFTVLFGVTQWTFSEFLIGPGAQNAFFGADRHWDYRDSPGPHRFRFWSETAPRWNRPATLQTFLSAAALALATSRVGLWIGNGMARVRR